MKAGLFLIGLLTSICVHSQILTGVVLEEDEKGNLLPLPGAVVFWEGTDIAAESGPEGVFKINDMRTTKRLIVNYIGFQSDTLSLQAKDAVTVILRQKAMLKTVEISARQASSFISSMNPVLTESITEKELFKAACCNLSESFETNASVDVTSTDAVTGAKQIRMLGLAGFYTRMQEENLPSIGGISSNYTLNYLPGSWIESIQISKGPGSVSNGFESITGLINTELKKPKGKEKTLLNGYFNQMGRMEFNAHQTFLQKKKLTGSIMMHGNSMKSEWDRNKDGFMDVPDGNQWNILNRWHYQPNDRLIVQFGFQMLQDNRNSGGIGEQHHLWIFKQKAEVQRGFAKLGYLFPEKRYKSIGLLMNGSNQRQNIQLGNRFYDAHQQSLHSTLIYQSIIGNTFHKFRTGLQMAYDKVDEQWQTVAFQRNEQDFGAFFEYTYSPGRTTIVAGSRIDRHNLFGTFVTPRVHLKWSANENFDLRLSSGRGRRTANILAENMSYLASNRQLRIENSSVQTAAGRGLAYGFLPELAWNAGGGLLWKPHILSRESQISADVFYTWFQRQIIADLDASPQEVHIYGIYNASSALTAQLEFNQEISRRFDMRIAYKYTNVPVTYRTSGNLQLPFVAANRLLANVSYHSRADKWLADITANYIGTKRLPSTRSNPNTYQFIEQSPDFWLVHAQITRNLGNFAIYLGVENALDIFQQNQIISATDSNSPYFDTSFMWGPGFGRMIYAGFRFSIK
jgi:outer membrane receptor for ferrienterochelin and colicin